MASHGIFEEDSSLMPQHLSIPDLEIQKQRLLEIFPCLTFAIPVKAEYKSDRCDGIVWYVKHESIFDQLGLVGEADIWDESIRRIFDRSDSRLDMNDSLLLKNDVRIIPNPDCTVRRCIMEAKFEQDCFAVPFSFGSQWDGYAPGQVNKMTLEAYELPYDLQEFILLLVIIDKKPSSASHFVQIVGDREEVEGKRFCPKMRIHIQFELGWTDYFKYSPGVASPTILLDGIEELYKTD